MVEPRVFEVRAATFQSDVVQRSLQTPILLDFWAEWCQPCKTLTPVLEKLANDFGGAFLLGKVNAEVELELAAAFQVRSIPFVCLVAGGRPLDAFTGALPEAEVRAFLAHAGIQPLGEPAPEEKADTPAGRLAAAKRAILAGDLGAARDVLQAMGEDEEVASDRDRLLGGVTALDEPIDPSESPAAAALQRGRQAWQRRQVREAMEAWLESIEHDRAYRDGMAHKAMLLAFAVAGEDDETSTEFRRRLATLLY